MLNKKKKGLTKAQKHERRHKSLIKSGDMVYIMTGKDKGQTGKVLKMDRVGHKVLVEGMKMVTKFQKADKKRGIVGKMFKKESFIHISNVKFFDGKNPIKLAKVDGKRVNKKTKKVVEVK